MKAEYILQPHEVGSKKGKSLIVLIPASVAKECNFDTNTVFLMQPNKATGTLVFQKVYGKESASKSMDLDTSVQYSKEVSLGSQ